MPLVFFYTPWKTSSFRVFSEDIEGNIGWKWVNVLNVFRISNFRMYISIYIYIYLYIYIFSDNIMYVLQIDIFTIYALYLCAIYINTDIWVNDYL